MEMTTEQSDDITIITPLGEHLDASNAEGFKRDIAPLLEGNARVLLDMSHIDFMDSAGLGALLSCLRRINGAGGDLKLFEMSKAVRAVVQITRMHRIFDIFDTKEEALQAFEG
jgi:anti-sigma B factor antagonist